MSNFIRNRALGQSAMIAVLAALGYAAPAAAQDTLAPAAEATQDEEIVVTATRRKQSLQKTPAAVSIATAEDMDRANVATTQDLARISPNLRFAGSTSETAGGSIKVRNIGPTSSNLGFESSTGVFIDGVYRARAGLALANLFDLESVQLLRGPQGTLFGKNTSSGALLITPHAPVLGEFDAMAQVSVGNFSLFEAEAMVNLPLGETAALRIAGNVSSAEGYIRNVFAGTTDRDTDRHSVRAMLLWEPSDVVKWRLTVDYAEKDDTCCDGVFAAVGARTLTAFGLVAGAGTPSTDPANYFVYTNRPPSESTEDFGVSSHLDFELPNGITLSTILAYRDYKFEQFTDADFTPADILNVPARGEFEQTSFEATLHGQNGPFDWLVGAFYSTTEIGQTQSVSFGGNWIGFNVAALGVNAVAAANAWPAGSGVLDDTYAVESSNWSVFTHNQIEITQKLGAVIGVRYTHEEKEGGLARSITVNRACGGGPFDSQGAAPSPGIANNRRLYCPRPTFFSTVEEDVTTGTIGLNYQVTDELMGYVSWSRGYKAGGINLDRDASAATGVNAATGLVIGANPVTGVVPATIAERQANVNSVGTFAPEYSDSFEIGLRGQFFDRTLTVNLTYFDNDYTDLQRSVFNGVGFQVSNAGTVENVGIELEGNWRATPDLTFTYGVQWADTKFGPDVVLAAGVSPTLSNAPKWNALGGVHYDFALGSEAGGFRGFIDLSAVYTSSFFTGSDSTADKFQEETTMVSGRIGVYTAEENGWEVALWGRNLTDEYYAPTTINSPLQTNSFTDFTTAPRTYGVSLKKNF